MLRETTMACYHSVLSVTDLFLMAVIMDSIHIQIVEDSCSPDNFTSDRISLLTYNGQLRLKLTSHVKGLSPPHSLSVQQLCKLLLNPSCRLLSSSLAHCCQEVAAMETTVPSDRWRQQRCGTLSHSFGNEFFIKPPHMSSSTVQYSSTGCGGLGNSPLHTSVPL